jgi:hypothetical protein
MMDSITDFKVMRLDQAGIVRSWQAGAQQLTRYLPEEIIGKSVELF